MQLTERLGYRGLNDLLDNMTWNEFLLWCEYDLKHPHESWRQNAHLRMDIAQAMGAKNLDIMEYMPIHEDPSEKAKRKMDKFKNFLQGLPKQN